MITCQFLYDLRALTGFISGSDLHELFQKLVGDPSPSGRVEIDLDRASELCPGLSEILSQSVKELLPGIAKYAGISVTAPRSGSKSLAELLNSEASSIMLADWLSAAVRVAEGF